MRSHLHPEPPPLLDCRRTLADAAGRQEWSGIDCVRALFRRKGALLWITCLGALAAALITAAAPRWYQSRASLEIQGFNENFLNLRDIYPTVASTADTAGVYVQTQVEILQQGALIEEVARKLLLEDQIDTVKQNIRIVPLRNSRIVQIVSDARSPQLAADIANTLAGTFIEQNIAFRQRTAQETYESLRRELREIGNSEANRAVYDAMLKRVNDARMASGIRQSNIRLVGPAQPASRPYKPNLGLNLAIGSLGGFLLAIGWVTLQEQTNSALRSPGEAGMYLTLPELGAIPKMPVRKLRVERAAQEQRSSSLSESFRTTLASILSARRNGSHPRILVVTSSRPNEGKTTVVSNLAIALAEISGKVLLIDGDMRRPRLHKVFDQANSWGLSDLLHEKNAIDELPLEVLVRKTAVPHLYLLPSGASTENVFGLLCSGRMSRLLPRFRQEFDYVLVDAPPCLEFADARIMARYAEELLLVVRANTDRKTAQAAVQRLLLDGIPVMGVILNGWDPAYGDMYNYPAQLMSRSGIRAG